MEQFNIDELLGAIALLPLTGRPSALPSVAEGLRKVDGASGFSPQKRGILYGKCGK